MTRGGGGGERERAAMLFTGRAPPKRKVDLRGRSVGEESREQILERTRVEREQRARAKLERRAAAKLQAVWRGRQARKVLRQELRTLWMQRYAQQLRNGVVPNGIDCFRLLLHFARPAGLRDVQAVACTCHLLLARTRDGGLCGASLVVGGTDPQAMQFYMTRMADLALRLLADNRWELQLALASPRLGAEADGVQQSAQRLVDFLVQVLDAHTWRAHPAPSEALHNLVQFLITRSRAYERCRQVLQVLAPRGAGVGRASARSYGETLVTQLTARCLAARVRAGRDNGPHALLAVPTLCSVAASMAPLSSLLCKQSVAALQGVTPQHLVALLPEAGTRQHQDAAHSRLTGAAAVLGNLLEMGPGALSKDATPDFALAYCQVLRTVVSVLPLRRLLDGSGLNNSSSTSGQQGKHSEVGYVDATEQDMGEAPEPADSQAGPSHSVLPVRDGFTLSRELRAQVASLSGATGFTIWSLLTQRLLPHEAPPLPSSSREKVFGAGQAAPGQAAPAVALCALLYEVLYLPLHGRRVQLCLAFTANFVARLWFSYLRDAGDAGSDDALTLALAVVCPVFSCHLMMSDSEEFYRRQRPLPLAEVHNSMPQPGTRDVLSMLKAHLWAQLWGPPDAARLASEGSRRDTGPAAAAAAARLHARCLDQAGRLFCLLYDRNCRAPFCPVEAFHARGPQPQKLFAEAIGQMALGHAPVAGEDLALGGAATGGAGGGGGGGARAWQVLQHAPCLIPFQDRAVLFRHVVEQDRDRRGEAEVAEAWQQGGSPFVNNRFVTVRRDHLVRDSFVGLNALGEALKGQVRVQFINPLGAPEAGIDGGGLFKDLMEELVQQGFSPQFGLFASTANNQLYPNPADDHSDKLQLLEFLGRMLGKAVYEGILLELPFAAFFLKKFRATACDINDLPSLDPEIYRNLLQLKHYQGDVSELGLNFTITHQAFDRLREIELKRGGRDTPVTNANVVEYINRVADYRLNWEMSRAVNAFLQGFFMMVERRWVQMFNEQELQLLISGSEERLDIPDLRAHAQYAGGYHEEHPVILTFWEALTSFSLADQRRFLRFVTACSRAPLLGFKYLEPPFCVQMAGSVLDRHSTERLPTSATCMNLLKLPPYSSVEMARDKLSYAINAGAGFDLS